MRCKHTLATPRASAPAVFMDEITSALRGSSGKCCMVYLDDILVFLGRLST